MNKLKFITLALVASLLSCAAKTNKEVMVEIETTQGTVKIKLYNETPQHKENFIKLVKKEFYEGLLFHRVIKDFMIQAGDPDSKGAPAGKHLGAGGPGYTLPAEIVYPKYYHKRGVLSAARQGDQVNPEKKSSGSQFYIVWGKVLLDEELNAMEKQRDAGRERTVFNRMVQERQKDIQQFREDEDQLSLMLLQDELMKKATAEVANTEGFKFTPEQRESYKTIGGTPHLDGEYTVFGEVIEGLDVIDKIQQAETAVGDRPAQDIKIIKMKIVK